MIWLPGCCLRDLFLSCMTWEAEEMRAPSGCSVVAAQTRGEHFFNQWREHRAEDKQRGSYHGHKVVTTVLNLGNYKNSEMINVQNMCERSQNYYYLCSSVQSKSIILGSEAAFLKSTYVNKI